MTDSGNELSETLRRDGRCAVCAENKEVLTELEMENGFLQICDNCRPAVLEGLEQ